MTDDDVTSEITINADAATAPALSAGDLAYLVGKCKRPDYLGRSPSDPAWVATYDVAWAIGRGWQLKAARVATLTDFSSGQTTYKRSQMRAALLDEAQRWLARSQASFQVLSPVKDFSKRLFGPANGPDIPPDLAADWPSDYPRGAGGAGPPYSSW